MLAKDPLASFSFYTAISDTALTLVSSTLLEFTFPQGVINMPLIYSASDKNGRGLYLTIPWR